MTATLDVQRARAAFPSLSTNYLFADNAGGSQCLGTVADNIYDYLTKTNVQLGADYSISVESTKRTAEASETTALLVNAASKEEIAFGASSTMCVENLARAMEADFEDGEELIISDEHEANVGPWKKLAKRKGLTVKFWHATQLPSSPNNPYAVGLDIATLLPLITPKTRLVAFTACSNILGSIVPVKEVIAQARAKGKEVGVRKIEFCVDCVAYAPHRRIDVRAWDVDYVVFSYYKVYGPHTAAMYLRTASLTSSLTSLAHHFLPAGDTAYKLMPGGAGYELLYGVTAVVPYLSSLSSSDPATSSHESLNASFALITAHEQTLAEPLLAFLLSQHERGVRVVGSEKSGESRAPTISFVVVGDRSVKSKDVVKVFDSKGGMGIRYGHFYAYSLIEGLGLDVNDAVVRISLVHYNTVEEVHKIIEVLTEVLA